MNTRFIALFSIGSLFAFSVWFNVPWRVSTSALTPLVNELTDQPESSTSELSGGAGLMKDEKLDTFTEHRTVVDLNKIYRVEPSTAPTVLDDALIVETAATEYAKRYEVSVDEAKRRLVAQDMLGDIEILIQEGNPDSFASLFIEHEPRFQIIVMSTMEEPDVLKSYFDQMDPQVPITYKTVQASYQTLEHLQENVAILLDNIAIAAESSINVFENRVEVYVTDIEALHRQLASANTALPQAVHLQEIEHMVEKSATLYGGKKYRSTFGNTCTFGFPVHHYWQSRNGLTTAGHCDNSGRYETTNMSTADERNYGRYDIQFMIPTTSGHTISNYTFTGSVHQRMRTVKRRRYQSVGSAVYKYGVTTGRTMGTIRSNTYRFKGSSTYVLTDMVTIGGDSGGPVFNRTTAYGSIVGFSSAGPHGGMIYMPMDYFSDLGLVLRQSAAGS